MVTRTLSKAFAMAGLRLGYLAADPAVVQAVQLVRLPYHLSSLTQAVARVALRHADDLLATVGELIEARERLVAGVAELGLETVPSDANFVLVGGFADARATWQALVDRGVLVRDPGLPGWLRVTAGTAAEVETFLVALAAVLDEEGHDDDAEPDGSSGSRRSPGWWSSSTSTAPARTDISTGVGFYDHMLDAFGRHGLIDLTVRTEGDLHVDPHHTVEDTAIALGSAVGAGARRPVRHPEVRLGARAARRGAHPRGGRPVRSPVPRAPRAGWAGPDDRRVRDVADPARLGGVLGQRRALPPRRRRAGRNAHHVAETQFKAVARALRMAAELDPRETGVPSTKGTLTA